MSTRRRAFLIGAACLMMWMVPANVWAGRKSPTPQNQPTPPKPLTARSHGGLSTVAIPANHEPAYTPYLVKARRADFALDARCYARLLRAIDQQYPETVSRERLAAGAAREVAELLRQAALSTRALRGMSNVPGLPGRIVKAYQQRVPQNLLWYAICRGTLAALHDNPAAQLMGPRESARMAAAAPWHATAGVGMALERAGSDWAVVSEVIPGTPVALAGIRPGDIVLTVDGLECVGLSVDEIGARVRGSVGTPVVITFKRGDSRVTARMMRALIQTPRVVERMLDADTGYVRLRFLEEGCAQLLLERVRALRAAGATRLVLDLRGTSSASLNAAVEVCSLFVRRGRVILRTQRRNEPTRAYRNLTEPTVAAGPMAILVDEGTAGMAEAVAGCLQEERVATLVGATTAGHGRIRGRWVLNDGSTVQMSMGRLRTPDGRPLDRRGLLPDHPCAARPRTGAAGPDPPLMRAVKILPHTGTGSQKS